MAPTSTPSLKNGLAKGKVEMEDCMTLRCGKMKPAFPVISPKVRRGALRPSPEPGKVDRKKSTCDRQTQTEMEVSEDVKGADTAKESEGQSAFAKEFPNEGTSTLLTAAVEYESKMELDDNTEELPTADLAALLTPEDETVQPVTPPEQPSKSVVKLDLEDGVRLIDVLRKRRSSRQTAATFSEVLKIMDSMVDTSGEFYENCFYARDLLPEKLDRGMTDRENERCWEARLLMDQVFYHFNKATSALNETYIELTNSGLSDM